MIGIENKFPKRFYVKKNSNVNKYLSKYPKAKDFVNIVIKMIVDGHNILTIMSFLKFKGFLVKDNIVRNLIKKIAINLEIPIKQSTYSENRKLIEGSTLFRRIDFIKYVLTRKERKIKKRVDRNSEVKIISEKFELIDNLINIFDELRSLLKSKDGTLLDKFIEKYKNHSEPGIRSLINGMNRDKESINNGIVYDITSGLVEGGDSLIKMMKRILCARIKSGNLLIRVNQRMILYDKYNKRVKTE